MRDAWNIDKSAKDGSFWSGFTLLAPVEKIKTAVEKEEFVRLILINTDNEAVIGDRKIKAEIKKREEAKQDYLDAIDDGNSAVLMEQETANIFTMNVGGIEKGETVQVVVEYLQRVSWENGQARFRYPLVVAPKFISGGTEASPAPEKINPKIGLIR